MFGLLSTRGFLSSTINSARRRLIEKAINEMDESDLDH